MPNTLKHLNPIFPKPPKVQAAPNPEPFLAAACGLPVAAHSCLQPSRMAVRVCSDIWV